MKKFLGIVLTILLCALPFTVKAVTADDEKVHVNKLNTLNFTEILEEEQIELKYKDYKETDDQVTIYLFRGNGCAYCRAFLNFLNDNAEELGKYFKVVGFEVWYDEANANVLKNISAFMGESASGVPYIIIGDQVFPGYAASYDEGIKAALTSLYGEKDRYDVFDEYNAAVAKAKREKYLGFVTLGIINAAAVAIAAIVVCEYVKKQNELLLEKIQETKTVKATKIEEEPKVVKKTTTKKTNKKKK